MSAPPRASYVYHHGYSRINNPLTITLRHEDAVSWHWCADCDEPMALEANAFRGLAVYCQACDTTIPVALKEDA